MYKYEIDVGNPCTYFKDLIYLCKFITNLHRFKSFLSFLFRYEIYTLNDVYSISMCLLFITLRIYKFEG